MRQKAARFIIINLALSVILLALASCGGDTGGGGSGGGATDTGINLSIQSIAPKDSSSTTSNIDVEQGTYANGQCGTSATAGQLEPFTDHMASVTIAAALVQGATSPPAGTTITITKYTVSYAVNSNYTGPSIPSVTYNKTITVSVGSSTSSDLYFLTLGQKSAFLTAVGGTTLNGTQWRTWPYTVTYDIYGQDEYGRDVSARGFVDVMLGNYYYACS